MTRPGSRENFKNAILLNTRLFTRIINNSKLKLNFTIIRSKETHEQCSLQLARKALRNREERHDCQVISTAPSTPSWGSVGFAHRCVFAMVSFSPDSRMSSYAKPVSCSCVSVPSRVKNHAIGLCSTVSELVAFSGLGPAPCPLNMSVVSVCAVEF